MLKLGSPEEIAQSLRDDFTECITGCGREWGYGYCGELCKVCAAETE
jgi:hypothetical protein